MSVAVDRLRALSRGLGELLITAGLVILLFCFYELKITNLYTDHEQAALSRRLDTEWAAPPTPAGPRLAAVSALPGDAVARLRIPRLGARFAPHVVVEGVEVDDLRRGIGHLPGTAGPGQVGNMVLSGHRTTYGAPFSDVDVLRPGDALVVETRDSWVTYRVTGEHVVDPTAVEVTLPVPGRPGVRPTQRLLTLTTCHPRYSAQQRLIVSARYDSSLPKSAGHLPPALAGA